MSKLQERFGHSNLSGPPTSTTYRNSRIAITLIAELENIV
jgi:hypothetical protein